MKKIFFYVLLLTLINKTFGQQCTATGANINPSLQVIKNIKTDFGAIGNGVADDHQAFRNASNFIQTNGGNVRLVIPDGVYIVGKQVPHIGTATNDDPVYEGDPVMYLSNISNVSIVGSNFSEIIFKDSMFFGTFSPTTGIAPVLLDLYNPNVANSMNQNPAEYYKYAGTIGNFMDFVNCQNIEVRNLEVNGNSNNYRLGGNWGAGVRPIQPAYCYGINIYNDHNVTLENLNVHHFGVDNILLLCDFTNGDTSLPLTYNIFINKVNAEFAGRDAISWVSGKNICVTNSSFNHSARKKILTSPGYGMDIEPEGNYDHVICANGYFGNNIYNGNGGLGFVAGTSRDNPVSADGFGFSYNHYFNKCKVIGSANSAIFNYINRVTYDSCKFYGSVLNYGSSDLNSINPAVFKNCLFSDCYNGLQMPEYYSLFNMAFSKRLLVDNCQFKKYFKGFNGWIYSRFDTLDCNDETIKPLFKNSTFNYFPAPTSEIIYADAGRKIKIQNNLFYKPNSDNIRWYNYLGCPNVSNPNGEGNVDLGNGLQYNVFADTASLPLCSNQIECEENIYLGFDTLAAQYLKSKDFIIADSKLTVNNQSSLFQAPNFIELNPGFEANMSGSAGLEIKIANCDVPAPPLMQANILQQEQILQTLENANEILVYPNPTSDAFIVRSKKSLTGVAIQLYDLNGRLQETKISSIDNNSRKIDCSKLSKGLYILSLKSNEKYEFVKVVVQ
jgi:Secretion system C-terminal sorting domain